MEIERELADYRKHLLDDLKTERPRSACRSSDPIQIFVNERRVGQLGHAGGTSTLHIVSHEGIHTVDLRSEDGTLLGVLAASQEGFRSERISLNGETVELGIHNAAQSGSVTAVRHPSPSLWGHIQHTWARVAPHRSGSWTFTLKGSGQQVLAWTHVVLVILVVGLVADRLTGWMSHIPFPFGGTQKKAHETVSLIDQVATLNQQVGDLAQSHSKSDETMETHQQTMAELQEAMADLSSTQERVVSRMQTVGHAVDELQRELSHEVDRMTRIVQKEALATQKDLADQLRGLFSENTTLSRDSIDGEREHAGVHGLPTSTGTEITTPTGPDQIELVAEQGDPTQSTIQAKGHSLAQQPLFLFWVTFSEGTSQDSIDQWVRQMQGHKGEVNEGWQAVQIVPPTEPIDHFLAQIKQDKIVKSVRVDQ